MANAFLPSGSHPIGAAAARGRLDAGERLPLLGVPIAIKDDTDVAGELTTHGSARVPFQAVFTVTGQPAAVVPWGLDGNGIPTSVQLVGRPFDEASLLSLGAHPESARPWAQRRPPVG